MNFVIGLVIANHTYGRLQLQDQNWDVKIIENQTEDSLPL